MMLSKAAESERAFIGAVINGVAHVSGQGLTADDFTDGFCRQLFSCCMQLETQGKQADMVTLSDTFDSLDIDAVVSLVAETAVLGCMADQYATNIRGASQRRRVTDMCLEAVKAVQTNEKPLEDTVNGLRVMLDRLAAQVHTNDYVSGTDAILDFALWLDKPEEDAAISTGFANLDMKLNGGLKRGRLYVIGARTSVGKSAFMCAMATHAIGKGARVLYVSLEMGARENITRMVAAVSGVSLGRISNRHTLSDGDYEAIAESYALLQGDNFRFSTKARTPEAVRRAALQMRAKIGLDLIVVDYLQILQPDGKTSSRVEALGQITGALKLLAMELDVPVLSAAQINRAGVQGGNAPRLSDLRESGSIEQDADTVILLHRPDGQEREEKKRLELAVAKNRQGSLGVSNMIFDGARMRFYPIDDRVQAV